MSAALHRILMSSVVADDRTRVLKHADAFGVFDHHGDIVPTGRGEQGFYSQGTRFLSAFLIDLEGARPFFLGATIRSEHEQLATSFTNPDLERGGVALPLGTIHLWARTFLWQDVLHRRIGVTNYASAGVDVAITLHFAADFADIYEVRGMRRAARGIDLEPVVGTDRVVLGYRGLDRIERRSVIAFSTAPAALDRESARFALSLTSGSERILDVSVACEREQSSPDVCSFPEAWRDAEADLERHRSRACRVRTGSERANAWFERANDDLHMLTTELPSGPYPYAGIPWFNTPFGRDGILTAFQCLWARPGLAKGVLRFLASTQATALLPGQDAEPGKILHESRSGEMARTGEMPFGRYYGAADTTPLFVMLAGEYFRRTNDLELARSLWPNVEAALKWIERFGDRDGDYFVEYQRSAPDGLLHQGWKDSDDAIVHADGSQAKGPIALAEVQGYVYAAWRSAAVLAAALGRPKLARDLGARAELFRSQVRRGLLVRGARNLRARAGRREATLPRAQLECRPVLCSAGSHCRSAPRGSRAPSCRPSRSRAGASARWRRPRSASIHWATTPAQCGRTTALWSRSASPAAAIRQRRSRSSRGCSLRARRSSSSVCPSSSADSLARPARAPSSTQPPVHRRRGRRARCCCSSRPASGSRSTASSGAWC